MADKFRVITAPYLDSNTDLTEEAFPNYVTILQGTESEVHPFFVKIQSIAEEINSGKFDDKLAFIGHVQKCNNVIQLLIETAGLTFQLPSNDDGTAAFAPGVVFYRQPSIPKKSYSHTYVEHFSSEVIGINPTKRSSISNAWSLNQDDHFSLVKNNFGVKLDPFSSDFKLNPIQDNFYSKHWREKSFIEDVKRDYENNSYLSGLDIDSRVLGYYSTSEFAYSFAEDLSFRNKLESTISEVKMDRYFQDSSRNFLSSFVPSPVVQWHTDSPRYLNDYHSPNSFSLGYGSIIPFSNGISTIGNSDPTRNAWGMVGGYLAQSAVDVFPITKVPLLRSAVKSVANFGGTQIAETIYDNWDGVQFGLTLVGRGTDD